MQDFVSFFFLLIVITIFYVHLENKSLDVVYVNTNGRNYLVRNLPDKEEAAKIMDTLNTKFKHLINACVENCDKNKNYTEQNKIDIKRLKNNYNENNISESSPGNKHTSYSINKGEKIVFCIRSKDGKNTIIDINTITFVGIHELAHLMTKSIGHNQEFWDNMKFLLKVAIENGIYTPQDFNKNPVEYCGTMITDTPLKVSNNV
tara:strand:+ start:235 stop:846 length:612 start_codon:yes stop_codon:yes gene_type:complete